MHDRPASQKKKAVRTAAADHFFVPRSLDTHRPCVIFRGVKNPHACIPCTAKVDDQKETGPSFQTQLGQGKIRGNSHKRRKKNMPSRFDGFKPAEPPCGRGAAKWSSKISDRAVCVGARLELVERAALELPHPLQIYVVLLALALA